MAVSDQYRSLSKLSRAIVVLLWLDVAAGAAYLLASLAFMSHLRARIATEGPGAAIDNGELVASEVVQLLIALLALVLTLTLVVVICRWIYRAAWNARHLGAKRFGISPGMAVGWYFIPFANLLMPFRAMREIWLASHDPSGWQDQRVGLISGWWGFWLVSSLVNNIAMRATLAADTIGQMHISELISTVGDALSIGASLLFIRVVRGVQSAQTRHEYVAELPPSPEGLDSIQA